MNLITGGTGIVGSRLAFDLIRKGFAVRCTKRSNSDLDFVRKVFTFYDAQQGEAFFNKIDWIDADLLDAYQLERALDGVSTVYHAAALVSYQKKDRQILLQTNAKGTANLINACLDSEVESFCHISSVAALGQPHEHGYTDENSKWNRNKVRSNYALSKYLAEKEVWRGNGEGLNVIVVNPSIVLGPAKPYQSSGSLMHMLTKGISYYPQGKTGFIDVRDVSKACIELEEKKMYGERFLLNAENLSYRELLELAAKIYGKPQPRIQVGKLHLEIARVFELLKSKFGNKPPRITSETLKSSLQTTLYSNEKIQSELGIEFFSVKEALNYYSEFFSQPV